MCNTQWVADFHKERLAAKKDVTANIAHRF